MKRIYWRPKQIAPRALALIGGISALSLVLVERTRFDKQQPHQAVKMEAAQLALQAFEAAKLAREKESKDFRIDPLLDPAKSGLIGYASSAVTSTKGNYLSKRTSINPNFAAAIVGMLLDAGVTKGDKVAVALSGSFPAINICTHAAVQTLGLEPIIISSAAASEWGANDPDFIWLDMERVLREQGIFKFSSVAATLGGEEDNAVGMLEPSIALLKKGIERNGVPAISHKGLKDGAVKRMKIYQKEADNREIVAYINVGGGQGSTGGLEMKEAYQPGLNVKLPPGVNPKLSVMGQFSQNEVPVIHMVHITDLARKFQLPENPDYIAEPGHGGIFARVGYNRLKVTVALALVLGVLTIFVRTHWGAQFLRPHAAKADSSEIEAMI